MKKLPIDSAIPEIIAELDRATALVLQAAPGTGKTTRVPPALLQCQFLGDRGEVIVLEPRRLAAKMSARRVAEERGEPVGETIGYQFRFENVSSPRTRVRFLTEGMLMRRLLGDCDLKGVKAVILDEFHERHLHTDVALGFLRHLQKTSRPDLRVVVMSATLDSEAVAQYLGGCRILKVEGRQFDVSVDYLKQAPERHIEWMVKDAVQRSLDSGDESLKGDMLVFLPGMAEIRRSAQALEELAQRRGLLVLPLHGELTREEQDRAINRADKTKVILSTNVAETSLTIEGVTTVIDSGLARVASYSWWSGLPALRTKSISRASAIQRAGRAGRIAPGRCFRLYTKGDFEGRASFEVPEIGRADLSQTVLEIKALGIPSVKDFGWFETPADTAIEAAESLLYRLGALDENGAITDIGRRMVEMPAHPRLARLVIEAEKVGLLREGATLAAFLSEGRSEGVDLLAQFVKYLDQARGDESVNRLRDRLISAGERDRSRGGAIPGKSTPAGNRADLEDRLAKILLTGYPDRVAKRRQLGASVNRAQGKNQSQVELVFASGGSAQMDDTALAASSEYFVAVDADERKGLGQARATTWVRSVCAIEPDWIFDLEPLMVRETDQVTWDPERKRVEAVSRMTYDSLVLSESKGAPRDLEQAARVLVDGLLASGGLKSICDIEALESLRARAFFLRENLPDPAFPSFSDEELRTQLIELAHGRFSAKDLEGLDVLSCLTASMPPEQANKLEKFAPAQVTLQRGRRAKIHYEPGKPPWIESRLQDFFGMTQGPSVLGGRIPLTLHLLAPNMRAVQVTSDLKGFWSRIYPDLRKELGRRYPRHAWPENPLQV